MLSANGLPAESGGVIKSGSDLAARTARRAVSIIAHC